MLENKLPSSFRSLIWWRFYLARGNLVSELRSIIVIRVRNLIYFIFHFFGHFHHLYYDCQDRKLPADFKIIYLKR